MLAAMLYNSSSADAPAMMVAPIAVAFAADKDATVADEGATLAGEVPAVGVLESPPPHATKTAAAVTDKKVVPKNLFRKDFILAVPKLYVLIFALKMESPCLYSGITRSVNFL